DILSLSRGVSTALENPWKSVRTLCKLLILLKWEIPSHGRGRRFNPYSAHHSPPTPTLLHGEPSPRPVSGNGRLQFTVRLAALIGSAHFLISLSIKACR